jgi:hypothetical protein
VLAIALGFLIKKFFFKRKELMEIGNGIVVMISYFKYETLIKHFLSIGVSLFG